MEEQGLLSVIVPAYNGERFLAETLESILKSTYKNLEVLLIDDGSTDRTGEICKEYQERDKRLRCFFQENVGIVGARNRGIQEAKGEYITFCDQDDLVHEQYYNLAIESIKKESCQLFMCSTARTYNSTRQNIRIYEKLKNKVYLKEEILQDLILPGILFNTFSNLGDNEIVVKGTIWNCVLKREFIEEKQLSFKKNVNYEDDTLMRFDILLNSVKVCTSKLVGYFWRTNLTSKSNQKEYIENIDEKLTISREYIASHLARNFSEEISQKYIQYRKNIDIVAILDNEISIKRKKSNRLEYLKSTMEKYMDSDKTYRFIKDGEVRYKIIIKLVIEKKYLQAFYFNRFLVRIRDILYKLHIAYFIENICKPIKK